MPLSTSAEVEASIISWTNAGITSAQAQDLITLGEDRIYRELRVRQMEDSTSMAITSGAVSCPTDLLEVKDAHIDSEPDYALQRKSPDWIYSNYPLRNEAGIPRFFARDGENFIFGPAPASGYSLVLNYWKRPATIVNGTLAGILASSPGLILYAALSESEPFLGRDQRIVVWEQKYQQLKELIMKSDRQERFSGSPLTVTAS
jgi:hypothetical protein